MSRIQNYVALVHGVEANTYRSVMQAERRELYASQETCRNVHRRYRTGLFSIGRPGIIANEGGR